MVSVGTYYFGEMAPEGADEPIPPAMLNAIVEVVEKEGYVYVPPEVLMQPYTGRNPGVTGIRDPGCGGRHLPRPNLNLGRRT
jgi:hypothetical protein